MLLSNCGMRTCRKELFGSYCWWKLCNISVWFPTVMLEENGGHGGSRCRWSEKNLVKIFVCDRKKVFHSKSGKFFAQEWKEIVHDRKIFSLPSEKNDENLSVWSRPKTPLASSARLWHIDLDSNTLLLPHVHYPQVAEFSILPSPEVWSDLQQQRCWFMHYAQ